MKVLNFQAFIRRDISRDLTGRAESPPMHKRTVKPCLQEIAQNVCSSAKMLSASLGHRPWPPPRALPPELPPGAAPSDPRYRLVLPRLPPWYYFLAPPLCKI